MPAREVAQIARQTMRVARDRQTAGDHLLMFVEGTRSRGGGMQRALPAVARYFEAGPSLLVPVGITGTERLVPVGEERIHSTCVRARIGGGVETATLTDRCRGKRGLIMDVVGSLIAGVLPAEYRGVYAADAAGIDEAHAIAAKLAPP